MLLAPKDHKGLRVCRVQPAQPEPKARRVSRVFKDPRVQMEPELLEHKARLDLRVQPAQLDQPVRPAQRAPTALRVRQVLPVLPARLDQPACLALHLR